MDLTTIITIAVIVVVFIVLFYVFKFLMRLLLIAVFLLLAWMTNPGYDQHHEAVQHKARENKVLLTGKKTTVEDFYVFSLTHVTGISGDKVVGAGAFTQVFIFRTP